MEHYPSLLIMNAVSRCEQYWLCDGLCHWRILGAKNPCTSRRQKSLYHSQRNWILQEFLKANYFVYHTFSIIKYIYIKETVLWTMSWVQAWNYSPLSSWDACYPVSPDPSRGCWDEPGGQESHFAEAELADGLIPVNRESLALQKRSLRTIRPQVCPSQRGRPSVFSPRSMLIG